MADTLRTQRSRRERKFWTPPCEADDCSQRTLENQTVKTLFEGKPAPFPFILEELLPIRPTIKRAFGFTYVYLDDKLLCTLRDSLTQPGSNGMWLFTTTEYVDSLGKEFPQLPRRYLWRSGKNAWVILASRLEDFEEYA